MRCGAVVVWVGVRLMVVEEWEDSLCLQRLGAGRSRGRECKGKWSGVAKEVGPGGRPCRRSSHLSTCPKRGYTPHLSSKHLR